jgi:hypothetical protein
MTRTIDRPWLLRTLLLTGLAACSSSVTEPDPPGTIRDPSELNIITLPADHPPFFSPSVSFWAKAGERAEGTIYFRDPNGERGDRFAELKIDEDALLRRPDGTPIAAGDSILITMTVSDQSEFLVEMQPSGLEFSSDEPAELKLKYEETKGDLNGNGRRDDDDDRIEGKLAIWVQEVLSGPFTKIGTVKIQGSRELKASLVSFSRFAIAY